MLGYPELDIIGDGYKTVKTLCVISHNNFIKKVEFGHNCVTNNEQTDHSQNVKRSS